jgi:hypothetical protein
MSKPYFRGAENQNRIPRRGATSHKAGFDQHRRLDNAERGFTGHISNDTDELNMYRALGATILTYPFDPGDLIDTTNHALGLTNQVNYLVAAYLPHAVTATGICYYVQTAGIGTWTTAKIGIYSSAGTLLASSSNDTALLKATGFIQKAFSSTVALEKGVYYLAVVLNASVLTTAPKLAGRNSFATNLANVLCGSSTPRATSITGATDLATPLTLSSGTLNTGTRWLGLY